MTILYSNGCSHTANRLIQENQRYPYIISRHFGWQLVDRSQPGSCNDRIIRCTMRDCIELMETQESIVAMVQLTHPARTEYPANADSTNIWKQWQDQHFESIKPNEEGLPHQVHAYLKSHLALFDKQATMTKLMCDLVGLVCFFRQHNIKYLIFNGPDELNCFEPENFYSYLKQDDSVLDLNKFNMLALTGQQQHPDVDGMKIIANHFISILQDTIYKKLSIPRRA